MDNKEIDNKDMENKGVNNRADGDNRTELNNPELLVGEYRPVEGEPATIKCPNCGEEMPTTIDTCVCCGHYLNQTKKKTYKPIAEDKAKKIRWIIGVICVVAFIVWYVLKKA